MSEPKPPREWDGIEIYNMYEYGAEGPSKFVEKGAYDVLAESFHSKHDKLVELQTTLKQAVAERDELEADSKRRFQSIKILTKMNDDYLKERDQAIELRTMVESNRNQLRVDKAALVELLRECAAALRDAHDTLDNLEGAISVSNESSRDLARETLTKIRESGLLSGEESSSSEAKGEK